MEQVRAALVLVAALLALLLSTPGLDDLRPDELSTPEEQARERAKWPGVAVDVATAVARFNEHVRVPLVDALVPLEVPFRLKQSWSLYTDGPKRVMRLEVRVDGRVVSRTGDPDYPWLTDALQSRRLRAMVARLVKEGESRNERGLTRWVGRRASEDFPGCQEVILAAMWGEWPGEELREHHRFVVRAPEWQ